jgi:hypothetical protein
LIELTVEQYLDRLDYDEPNPYEKKKVNYSTSERELVQRMPFLAGSRHQMHQLIQETQGQIGCEVFL